MSRFIKQQMIEAYESRFEGMQDLAVVNTQGIDVLEMTGLRSALRERGLRAMVVKNSLCRKALEAVGAGGAGDLLDGPSTLVWGGDGIVDIAKALVEQAKTVTKLEIRGGFTEGQLLTKDDIDALSKMPSREELIGMAVGKAIGQAARVVALAMAPASGLLGQIREIGKDEAEAEAA